MTQMFSPTALVVGLYREFFELNLVNTYLALILTNTAFNLAFAIWILQGFFSSIPREVEEAAQLDGCSRHRHPAAGHAAADPARPGHRRDLHVHRRVERVRRRADADAGRRQEAADRRHQLLRHRLRADWDQLFAASLIAIVPVVILFAVIEKHLVGGLTAGAVK